MNETKTQLLNPTTDKYLIDEYFNLTVRQELNIDIDLSFEYMVAQNIISKKTILVKTFSDFVMGNPELHNLLHSLIYKVNTYSLTRAQIITALETLRKNQ